MKTYQQTHFLSMRKLLVLIVYTLIISMSKAQDTPYLKSAAYKVIVVTNTEGAIKGYLHSIYDTSVYISEKPVSFKGYVSNHAGLRTISYNDISSIRLRRKGSTGWGMLIGALTGAAVGAIAGLASGDDHPKTNTWCIPCFTAGEKAAALGLVSGMTGFGVGAVVGAIAHKTFTINHNKEMFDEFKWKLMH